MGKTSFDQLPDELDCITAMLAECDDPTGGGDRGCGWKGWWNVHGPVPRLNADGYIEAGSKVPTRCPDCDSPHLLLNGVQVQF